MQRLGGIQARVALAARATGMMAQAISTGLAQVNIHHAKAASAVLARIFTQQHLGLALVQEPWVNDGIKGLYTDDSKVIWDQRDPLPRTCIMVRKCINYTILSEFLTRDSVPIMMQAIAHTIVVAFAYLAGDGPYPPPEIMRLVEHCQKEKLPLLIGFDANAHHEIWGSTDTNQRGECHFEFILTHNLEIGNVGTTPTFVIMVRDEVLDVNLLSRALKIHLRDWHVSAEESMSDHGIILYKLKLNTDCSNQTRNPRKTNWGKFSTTLGRNLAGIISGIPRNPPNLESVIASVNNSIINAYEVSCALGKKRKAKDAPWWSGRWSL